jgi:sarcosine oxidase subunit alpha
LLAPGLALDSAAFPHMTLRETDVAGIPARIFRVSFSGELSYEINVPADQGLDLWEQLIAAGEPFGITSYGTEAMHVMRAEKGHIIVGQETDGSVTPVDLGLGGLIVRDKDFLGRRSLARSDIVRRDRKQLVGLLPDNPGEVLPEGAALVDVLGEMPPVLPGPHPGMVGHVTSRGSAAALRWPWSGTAVPAMASRSGPRSPTASSPRGSARRRSMTPPGCGAMGEGHRSPLQPPL